MRFGLLRFRSPLLTEYLFLWVLRCFNSPRSHQPSYIFRWRRLDITPARFPHSDTLESTSVCRLPEAYRRLPRPSSAPNAKASTDCSYKLTQHNKSWSQNTKTKINQRCSRPLYSSQTTTNPTQQHTQKERPPRGPALRKPPTGCFLRTPTVCPTNTHTQKRARTLAGKSLLMFQSTNNPQTRTECAVIQ